MLRPARPPVLGFMRRFSVRYHLQARLQARLRRYCVETAQLAIPVRLLESMDAAPGGEA